MAFAACSYLTSFLRYLDYFDTFLYFIHFFHSQYSSQFFLAPFIYSFCPSFLPSFIHSFICSFSYPVHIFIHLLTHSFISLMVRNNSAFLMVIEEKIVGAQFTNCNFHSFLDQERCQFSHFRSKS